MAIILSTEPSMALWMITGRCLSSLSAPLQINWQHEWAWTTFCCCLHLTKAHKYNYQRI